MAKKQIVLRLSDQLYNDIAAWAADDFRSVNGQIEFLLSECVKRRRRITEGMNSALSVLTEPAPGEADPSAANQLVRNDENEDDE